MVSDGIDFPSTLTEKCSDVPRLMVGQLSVN